MVGYYEQMENFMEHSELEAPTVKVNNILYFIFL
jgi:hypothetical protein